MAAYIYQVIVNRQTMHERTVLAPTIGAATAEMESFCRKVGGTHTIGPVEVDNE